MREWRFDGRIPGYTGRHYGNLDIPDGTNVVVLSAMVKENRELSDKHILELHNGLQYFAYKREKLPEI